MPHPPTPFDPKPRRNGGASPQGVKLLVGIAVTVALAAASFARVFWRPGAQSLPRGSSAGLATSASPSVVEPPLATEVPAPVPSSNPTDVWVTPTFRDAATRTIATLRPKFKHCYQMGLVADPTMSGTVKVVVKIDKSGEVVDVQNGGGSGLSPDVVACVMRVTRVARFEAPGGAGTTIDIPVKLVQ